jgi:phenylpyruvate tautomerase PptA (4-oxalocrotonate tautomerase family)
MPILEVEIVQPDGVPMDPALAAGIADAAGEVFESAPMRTWVRLRALPLSQYAENGGGPPQGVAPVFVTVLKAALPPPDRRQEEVRHLTQRIAVVCRRPAENVHVLYSPDGAGRAAFGGRLVER